MLLLPLFYESVYGQSTVKLKSTAELLAKATVASDFKTVVKYTYPKVVKAMGGPDKIIAVMNKGFQDMKSQGAAFKDAIIGEPGQILTGRTEFYSVVPLKLIMESNGEKFYTTSSLLAISADKGKNWTFIDAGNMTKAQLKQFFPEVYTKLIIPKLTEPVVID